MKETRVAIQGGRASFHDFAARLALPNSDVEIIPCWTFGKQMQTLIDRNADHAVMAIENTLAGSILPNYALLEQSPVTIVGEVYLRIEQNLMALPGQKLSDIKFVKSHPMALHQCSNFIEAHPHLHGIESEDTAESAREIREQNQKGVAAIASKMAAEAYDLEILAASIENIKENYTRFLSLTRSEDAPPASPSANKASLRFTVLHKVGALAQVMNVFRDNGLNLCLIQSIPIPGKPDEYSFHVDVEWLERPDYDETIRELAGVTRHLKVLGEYRSGSKPYQNGSKR
jgi:prephenate dehydratase